MTKLLLLIAQILAPAIAELIAAYLGQLVASIGEKDERQSLAVVARDIVDGVARTHPEWTGEEKRRCAFDALSFHAKQRGLAVSDSMLNATIELAVVRSKQS